MATATSSTALVTILPVFTGTERLALAGFLAGYSGLTREAYELDLRQFTSWCQQRPFPCSRPAARTSSASPATLKPAAVPAPPSPGGCAPWPGSTSTRSKKSCWIIHRPLTSAGPGWTMSRTPQVWTVTSSAQSWSLPDSARRRACADLSAGPQRAAGLRGHRRRHRALGLERGHRTLVITRKGGKVVTIPLAPRTARAIDLAIGERSDGPIFLAADGRRLDRHGAGRIVRRIARRAGIAKPVGPHAAARFHHRRAGRRGPAARRAGSRVHADPRTTMRYDNSRKLHQMHEPNASLRQLAACTPRSRLGSGLSAWRLD